MAKAKFKSGFVAIVGRPNVGKSTIFNRIIVDRLAIVEDKPGITRDRIYGASEWNGKPFSIIDTGGIELDDQEPILKSIRMQAELAIEEADVIVFMCDAKAGVTSSDEEVANLLYRSGKPVIVAVNKVDNIGRIDNIYEFYNLGFGEPIGVSGSHGTGIGDLLEEIVKHFPNRDTSEYDDSVIRFCLIGRPNVGKSSLVNAILGRERVIVSNIPGTTRDAIDTPLPDAFILLHPYARGAGKSLDADQIRQLCEMLAPHPVVLAGVGQSPEALPSSVVDLTGRTTLLQLIHLLRQARTVISVDSGPMHLAAAVGARLLSIHTWSDPRKVGPYFEAASIWQGGEIRPQTLAATAPLLPERPLTTKDLEAIAAWATAQPGS